MLSFILLSILCAVSAQEQNDEGINPDDKMQCVNELLNWCEGMQYRQQGGGIAMIASSYQDDTGYHRMFCSSDSDGTNCTRNGSPWYSCSPDHTLTYKGEILTEATADVDDDICKTAEKARNQFQTTYEYDNATWTGIQAELGSFFEEMAAMQEQMRELQKRLSYGFSAGGDFWSGFPFQKSGPTENPSATTEDSNNIERE